MSLLVPAAVTSHLSESHLEVYFESTTIGVHFAVLTGVGSIIMKFKTRVL